MIDAVFRSIPSPLLTFELCSAALAITVAFVRPQLGKRWFEVGERFLVKIARTRGLSILLMGLLAFGSSAGVSLLVYMPQPCVQDEFSYLLASDTFAHWRLTNPTHPMWVHFESFHIIHHPSYASKYPPGQGLILAVGQVLTGYPIVGVWISMGLFCAALCWMLKGWLPPTWALLGSFLTLLRTGFVGHQLPAAVFGYWGQTYWGGAVAGIGGALVFGALPRILKKPSARYASVLGLGVAVLALTRPFEGGLCCVPIASVLITRLLKSKGPALRLEVLNTVVPLAITLALTLLGLGFYNYRVTGSFFRMPYQEHESQYSSVPLFLGQHEKQAPVYRHREIQGYYTQFANDAIHSQNSLPGWFEKAEEKCLKMWSFFIGGTLILPLALFPWVLRLRRMHFAMVVCALVIGGITLLPGPFPHYIAPITGLIFVFVVNGMRCLRTWKSQGKRIGPFINRALIISSAVSILIPIKLHMGRGFEDWSFQRARILDRLQHTDGQHLVVVRYAPQHNFHAEWVYNDADIDNAKVVWAREMDDAQNAALFHYFANRKIWLLEADETPEDLQQINTNKLERFSANPL